ncbi:MAG TPA: hypothetical protein VFV66_29375 [Nonomuraea sp.]|nr:hypothetical protein [Nonomuraea sp.]
MVDGRRATTHWRNAERFRRRHPEVRLDPDSPLHRRGALLASAGSARRLVIQRQALPFKAGV